MLNNDGGDSMKTLILNGSPRHDGDIRACSVSFYVRIFEHNFVDYKEKIRRHTDVW